MENEDLERDIVDKRKCFLILRMKENKFQTSSQESKKRGNWQKLSSNKSSTQELDQEVEEVIRLGRFSEGGKRPMKARMRLQVEVEDIMIRKGKLADDTESKDIWIKRDMNLEEKEKEKVLRNEAKEKIEKRMVIEKNNFYWRVLDMRQKKWYLQ
ncbi:hypothetical protein E2C01_054464 [Portunus trituberculatus]|uniref:Uncharacterized protein n=1 Tax=Portunus trituberculatus TaxID=210409 RepID=A0A5B7GJM1_PORTR|nr:hypothetical protein [Portunus trituberculatus]